MMKRLRMAATKLMDGLKAAVCAPNWMPGTTPGLTASGRHGEHRADRDEG
jgi:hypothetical protein